MFFSLDLLRTNSIPSPYLGRFMFGIRLKAKPEHEAAQVRRWYGADTAMGRRKGGEAVPFHHAGQGGDSDVPRGVLAFFSFPLWGHRMRGREFLAG